MTAIWNGIKSVGGFIASLLDPAASLISRYPKGTMIVWAVSLVLVAWKL